MRFVITTVAGLSVASASSASFTVVKGIDNWNAAVASSTTLDFVFGEPQVLSTQYLTLGVFFPEGEEVAQPVAAAQQDGWGCRGQIGGDVDIHLKFLQPQYAIGAWFPGKLFAKLYWQGALVYSSQSLETFPQTYAFGGIVSTQPFDEAVLWDDDGFVVVDDIKFSATVPAPSAVSLVLASGFLGRSRARTRSRVWS